MTVCFKPSYTVIPFDGHTHSNEWQAIGHAIIVRKLSDGKNYQYERLVLTVRQGKTVSTRLQTVCKL